MKDDKRVIFNADDFGLSSRVNSAVIEAHREGLLNSASLMVNEPGAEEAVSLARAHPKLELGLHFVLCQGRSTMPPAAIPGLVGPDGRFPENPVWTGMKLFFAFWLKDEIRRELDAQLERFRHLVGRRPAHVNGHLNIHVHPTVLEIVIDLARAAGVPAVRLPREPAPTIMDLDPRDGFGTRLNGFIFERLSSRAVRLLDEAGIAHAQKCYGVLRPFMMTEALVEGLLERLEPGLTELYFHPGHPAHGNDDPELAALRSPRIRARLQALGIRVVGFDNAVPADPVFSSAPLHATA